MSGKTLISGRKCEQSEDVYAFHRGEHTLLDIDQGHRAQDAEKYSEQEAVAQSIFICSESPTLHKVRKYGYILRHSENRTVGSSEDERVSERRECAKRLTLWS